MLARENQTQVAPVSEAQVSCPESAAAPQRGEKFGEIGIGLVLLILVSVMAVTGLAAEPRSGPTKGSVLATPEQVRWYPAYKTRGPGLCAQEARNGCADFLTWEEFKADVEQKVLPQAKGLPPESTLMVGADGQMVSIVAPNGREVGVILMQGVSDDGLILQDGFLYIADPQQKAIAYKFQRFSNGSYLRTPMARVELTALFSRLALAWTPRPDAEGSPSYAVGHVIP